MLLGVLSILAFSLSAQAADGVLTPGPLALRSVASVGSSETQAITAQVYAMGSDRKDLLFKMRREEKTEGPKTTITEIFTDMQGKEALRTVTELEGDRFVSYDFKQEQIGATARIDAKGGKIFFQYAESPGKTKKDDEDWRDNFVVGATMGRFVKAHWQEILAGKDVEMRFGVPERQETVGFKIFKEGEKRIDGHDVIVTKMKPTSVFISALVDPLHFYFDKSDGRLIEFIGRTLPRIRDGDHWKDLDAESVYSYGGQ